MSLHTIEWVPDGPDSPLPGRVRMVDQTRLPEELVYLETRSLEDIWQAIRRLQVRGAPAIGIAAAMGLVLSVQALNVVTSDEIRDAVTRAADYLAQARPTAVNLFWALDRMRRLADEERHLPPAQLREELAREAMNIAAEDARMCRAIGEHGLTLLQPGQTVLTHCNAGGLATSQYGTALAPIYLGHEKGYNLHVIVDETRPLLQGSRLTAWELMQAGIDITLICDNTAARVMQEGRVNAVLVGADRIVANGDAANKIGTYGLAVLAQAHGIPFYVLAPSSSFDLRIASGEAIPIEQRDPREVTEGFGRRTAPPDVKVYSPAFDVTPAKYITAIVCEKGIARPPYGESLKKMLG
ncbi:MAG: S-methyl-5-thioribose-1-phosphate isomerase [Kiritimatiellae bacterium]|nr:S-methyl-5-thioribose-1-phosphate isomerase [Kiritimatiellia bacterium]